MNFMLVLFMEYTVVNFQLGYDKGGVLYLSILQLTR